MNREWTQVVAVMLTLVGGVWVLSWNISSIRSDNIASIAAVRADNLAAIAATTSRISADEERLTALEKLVADQISGLQKQISEHYTEELAFRSEMRISVGRVSDLLSDVRVSIAQRNHGGK